MGKVSLIWERKIISKIGAWNFKLGKINRIKDRIFFFSVMVNDRGNTLLPRILVDFLSLCIHSHLEEKQ